MAYNIIVSIDNKKERAKIMLLLLRITRFFNYILMHSFLKEA
jgi:hypothetical protein